MVENKPRNLMSNQVRISQLSLVMMTRTTTTTMMMAVVQLHKEFLGKYGRQPRIWIIQRCPQDRLPIVSHQLVFIICCGTKVSITFNNPCAAVNSSKHPQTAIVVPCIQSAMRLQPFCKHIAKSSLTQQQQLITGKTLHLHLRQRIGFDQVKVQTLNEYMDAQFLLHICDT